MNDSLEGHRTDHDLLIRIDTKLDGLDKRFEIHQIEIQKKMAIVEQSVATAHRRVDSLTLNGVFSLIGIIITGVGIIVTVVIRTAK